MTKEERNVKQKAWREANKDKVKAYNKKDRAMQKAWREANKEKMKAYNKNRYEANKEKKKIMQKAWNQANKDKIKVKNKKYSNNLKDGLIAQRLGFCIADCPPSLIEAKRAQLQLYRATR